MATTGQRDVPLYTAKAKEFKTPGVTEVCRGEASAVAAVSQYSDYYDDKVDAETQRNRRIADAQDVTATFYNLVTDFYEYGYGQSFHFAPIFDGMTFDECIAEYERDIAKSVEAKPGMKILDVGCGVGGPQREIAKFSGAHVVGFNYNAYQLSKARDYTKKAELENLCSYIQGDYCKMEIEDNSYDGAYALESICHAKDPLLPYSEIFRVLKPGSLFVEGSWVLTDNYNNKIPEHVKIIDEVALGNGLPELRHHSKIKESLLTAGFEIIEMNDLAKTGDLPWHVFLAGKGCSFQNFRASNIGRWTTHAMLSVMETIGMAPSGSTKVHGLLQTAASGLIAAGQKDIFTPMLKIVARKPL
eukprot:Em0023g99a